MTVVVFSYIFGMVGLLLFGWSFKRILKIVIGCVGITHCYGENDRRTCTFIRTSRYYLRFYFLMLLTGITLIVFASIWVL